MGTWVQWWANRANPNPDLAILGFVLNFFDKGDLDLRCFRRVDLDSKVGLDLDVNIIGFAHYCLSLSFDSNLVLD